ncbi:hypothetical protein CDO44_07180 [Pigmentiphaga sp. NML080357]|uniref:glycosyltransferase family 2 protein n=1 Tax=Pigmentiphaga sp. NML080357 TaxID=2008675 RepID=UPI000B41BEDB|nr:glycosyltransferase family 2 protein [Pigmentiphaga sp. NML080357]OVZ60993.1 hypothetical protein CDO44_07180 [Pigmentiphaga sp. NML080357]
MPDDMTREIMSEEIISDNRPLYQTTMPPLISWVVPVFNTENLLVETLDSIAAENGPGIEIIIVDDGSTDGSSARIAAWIASCKVPTLHIRQENAGLSAARMMGVKYATGEFIGFCDSDDFVEISCYTNMASLAKREKCDVAICRSVVFDSVSQIVHDFYDTAIWNEILHGRSCVVTSARREPRIFRFEPNANTRLLRRSFLLEKRLAFPLGLHFEDFPVHVEALAAAGRVLLVDSTGYYYRVNRPGKITDQKSEKRFDILKSVELGFSAMKRYHVDAAGRAYIAIMATRMTYWCGKHTLNKDRKRFFIAACEQIGSLIDPVAANYCMANGIDRREAILVSAFRAKAARFLIAYSSGRKTARLWIFKLLFSWKHGRKLRRTLIRAGLRRIRNGTGRFVFMRNTA